MKINHIPEISNQKGDWLVITDYGCEGLAITSQHKTVEGAVLELSVTPSRPNAILYLPDVNITTVVPKKGAT